MDNSWHKFKSGDKSTYPTESGKYVVFCIRPDVNGRYIASQDTLFFDCCHFITPDKIVLYWKEFDYPEGFDL